MYCLTILLNIYCLTIFIPSISSQTANITDLLEIDDHVLFGSETPVWLVKTKDINVETGDAKTFTYELFHPSAESCVTQRNESRLTKNEDTVYPEILIFVDYRTYEYHNKSSTEVKEYMIALYNNYDLILRQMTEPKIRLNIAGIVIAGDELAVPFANHRTRFSQKYFNAMKTFFRENIMIREFNYDLITIVLHRDFINVRDEYPNSNEIGFADSASACDTDSLILIRSTGSYADSPMAVTYLIRALGLPPTSEEQNCEKSEPFETIERMPLYLTNCSTVAMRNFFREPRAACLKNKPFVGTPYKKTIPVKMSLDEQCTRANNGTNSSSKWLGKECMTLQCSLETGGKTFILPAQGSACNKRGICIDGECETFSD